MKTQVILLTLLLVLVVSISGCEEKVTYNTIDGNGCVWSWPQQVILSEVPNKCNYAHPYCNIDKALTGVGECCESAEPYSNCISIAEVWDDSVVSVTTIEPEEKKPEETPVAPEPEPVVPKEKSFFPETPIMPQTTGIPGFGSVIRTIITDPERTTEACPYREIGEYATSSEVVTLSTGQRAVHKAGLSAVIFKCLTPQDARNKVTSEWDFYYITEEDRGTHTTEFGDESWINEEPFKTDWYAGKVYMLKGRYYVDIVGYEVDSGITAQFAKVVDAAIEQAD
ncbi:MAG: hypothetical protein ABIF92_02065 [archaeon]